MEKHMLTFVWILALLRDVPYGNHFDWLKYSTNAGLYIWKTSNQMEDYS